MEIANEQWVRIRDNRQMFQTLDVVPLKHTCDGKKCEGIVISPGAGISRVEFSKDELVENSQTVSK